MGYLLELFGPILSNWHRKTLGRLKKIQKRFGGLNDVFSSEKLLRGNGSLLSAIDDPEMILNWWSETASCGHPSFGRQWFLTNSALSSRRFLSSLAANVACDLNSILHRWRWHTSDNRWFLQLSIKPVLLQWTSGIDIVLSRWNDEFANRIGRAV